MDSYRIAEGDHLERIIRTPLEEAIYDVLGGPTLAADRLGVSRQAAQSLATSPYGLRQATAFRIAKATREAGCEVPAAELLGVAPWCGPERHNGSKDAANGKGGRPMRPRARSPHAERPSAGAALKMASGWR